MGTSLQCLHLPAPISALAFGPSGWLGVASDDGTVRIYHPPYSTVAKAVKTMASEISSLVFGSGAGQDTMLWIACGQHVLCFSLESPKMILERKDAALDVRLTDKDEDVLNEITVNATHIAYTLDSGSVGILDLKSHEKTLMKASHTNLCACVSFIPDRPREIVSGGYDSTLLHSDFHSGSLVSSLNISGPTDASAGVSLSPPFVLNISVSPKGTIACGLADGRIWLGSGGNKSPGTNKRKAKRHKWDGLRAADGQYFKVAEGPIITVFFVSPTLLLSLTLLGTLKLHVVESRQITKTTFIAESPELSKANSMAVYGSCVVVGGIGTDDKGILLLQSFEN